MIARFAGQLAALIVIGLVSVGCEAQQTATAPPAEPLPAGGDFQLTDDDGQPFTLASQRGKIVLIFFGYSSCPDACPTTLSKLSTAVRRLGEDGKRVRALYVSVDPERDTPDVLKADLANFTLDAVGLTGTREHRPRCPAVRRLLQDRADAAISGEIHHLAYHGGVCARSARSGQPDVCVRGQCGRRGPWHPRHHQRRFIAA